MNKKIKIGFGIGLLLIFALALVGVGLNQSAFALSRGSKDSAQAADKTVISEEQAKKIALEKVNGEIVEFEPDHDDGQPEYDVEIRADGKEYDMEIDGYTGEITKLEVDDDDDDDDDRRSEKESSKSSSGSKASDKNSDKQLISEEQARKIALEKVNGKIVEFELDYNDGHPEYDVEISADGKEYDLEIDGYTGKITKFEVDDDDDDDDHRRSEKESSKSSSGSKASDKNSDKQLISEEQARKIALEKVNGKIVEFELDYDDGHPEYEIEIRADGKEYDLEIDGYTGKITKFEVDND
jgi:uncharacterized membrane protein YkoI